MRRWSTAITAVLAALSLAGSAHAQAPGVEGVWSFEGGQIAIQKQADGTFDGTIVRATRFAACDHPVGELTWVGMTLQPDGQYHGRHQWFATNTCTPIAERGPTAWRLLTRPDGAYVLRVCFSTPGPHGTQPNIAADGSSTGVTHTCHDSKLIRPLPKSAASLGEIVTGLPASSSSRRCTSRRSFRIRLKEPRGDALQNASVFVNGKRVTTRRGKRLTAPIVLRGLPKGRYTVRITAETVLQRTITGTRKYRTCTPKRQRKSTGPI